MRHPRLAQSLRIFAILRSKMIPGQKLDLEIKKSCSQSQFVFRLRTRLDISVFEKLWSKNKYENNLKDFCLTKPFRHFDTKFHKTRSI